MLEATPVANLDQVPSVENEAKNNLTSLPTVGAKIQKTRGRPPKASGLAKKSRTSSSSDLVADEESKACAGASTATLDASERKRSSCSLAANATDPSAVKFENEVEDHNISSTSAAAKCLTSPKVRSKE